MEASVGIASCWVGTCDKPTNVVRNCRLAPSIIADFVIDFSLPAPLLLVLNTLKSFNKESTSGWQN